MPKSKKNTKRKSKNTKDSKKLSKNLTSKTKSNNAKANNLSRPKLTKKNTLIGLLLIIAGLLYYFRGVFIAATVNGKFITRSEVVSELEKQAGAEVLESLITKKLIFEEAKEKGVSVSESEVSQEIEKSRSIVQAQGMTLEDALELQGQDIEKLIDNIKIQKTVEKLLGEKIAVSQDEISDYFEENKDLYEEDVDLSQVRDQIESQLKQDKLYQEYQGWIENLQNQADINYFVYY